MPNAKNIFCRLILAVVCFAFLISAPANASADAAAKLEAGKKLYNERKYDAAMDNFIEVFISGNSAQIAEANEYVNLIHFAMGGVDAPKRVPYDPMLEQSRAEQPSRLTPPRAPTQASAITNTEPPRTPTSASSIIVPTQQPGQGEYVPFYEEYYDAVGAEGAGYFAAAPAPQQEPQEAAQQAPAGPATPETPDTYVPFYESYDTDMPSSSGEPFGPYESYEPYEQYESNEPVIEAEPEPASFESIVADDILLKTKPKKLAAMRREAIDAHITFMTNNILERLSKHKGVVIYTRNGMVDALDIQPDIIFERNNNFKLSSKPVLEDLYALMLVSGKPTFVLLPEGAFTDNVSIRSVRQVIALNSYLINMGLSSGKISFNMGLNSEQPPVKFSNIEGLGIVFDYTTKPVLKRKLSDKDTPPVLSLGMYPFASFTPAKNEGMLIDFSVIEASSPVADWSLQIVHHGKDGKFFIVRQVSGMGAAYKQIFWNGKKQYFGEVLPAGDYILVLRAKDIDGREKALRRRVTLNGVAKPKTVAAPKAAPKAAAVVPPTSGAASANDYTARRLWTKPARIQKAAVKEPAAQVPSTPAQPAEYDPYMPVPAMDGAPDQYTMPVAPASYDDYNTPYPSQMPAADEPGGMDYEY